MDLWTPNNDIAVSIGGKPLFSFKSLRLHQPINDHHRFELALDFEVAAKAWKTVRNGWASAYKSREGRRNRSCSSGS